MKAMIVNRVGDFGLSLGMFAVFFVFKTIDFNTIFSIVHEMSPIPFIFFNME